MADTPRLYGELAQWWPLLSPPSHYVEEAGDLLPRIMNACDPQPQRILELGCGGGSLAFHLKKSFDLTLTDRSSEMLEQSRAVNPECRHLLGDMRSIELNEQFDAVFIHDAIMYAADRDSVRATLRTAARHCRTGGAVIVVPDCVKETFEPGTSHGGEDGDDGRGLRYLEWKWDPDPTDETYNVTYGIILREADGSTRVEHDLHIVGLFPRAVWLDMLAEAGFAGRSEMDRWNRDIFVGCKN